MLMSATLDLADLRGRLPEATVLESEGRSHPITTTHQPPRMDESLPLQVLRAIEAHALSLPKGSGVLVFLPGIAEIDRCRDVLEKAPALHHWQVQPLHGQIPLSRQSEALQPCPARCDGKVCWPARLPKAPSRLTGCVWIDSGLSRQLRYDPNTGMEGLETVPASLASADQRRGRAGRQGPGHRIRRGRLRNSSGDQPSASRICSWRIRSRWSWNWLCGERGWGRAFPGSIHRPKPRCRKAAAICSSSGSLIKPVG